MEIALHIRREAIKNFDESINEAIYMIGRLAWSPSRHTKAEDVLSALDREHRTFKILSSRISSLWPDAMNAKLEDCESRVIARYDRIVNEINEFIKDWRYS